MITSEGYKPFLLILMIIGFLIWNQENLSHCLAHSMSRRPMYCMKLSSDKLIGWKLFMRKKHTGQIIEIMNRKYRVKCLYKSEYDKWWKLEPDCNAVWYHQSDIIGRSLLNEPKIHHSGGLFIELSSFIECLS